MQTIQEAIYKAQTEDEFRKFCDDNPEAGVANAQVGVKAYTDGVYQIHLAGCDSLKRGRHVEGQADTKYEKYLANTWQTLADRWPKAARCSNCIQAPK